MYAGMHFSDDCVSDWEIFNDHVSWNNFWILPWYFGQVGYHYSPSGKPYPDNWIISDIIYETEGGVLQSRLVVLYCF